MKITDTETYVSHPEKKIKKRIIYTRFSTIECTIKEINLELILKFIKKELPKAKVNVVYLPRYTWFGDKIPPPKLEVYFEYRSEETDEEYTKRMKR
jgi:hypothetical protein